MVRTDVKQRKAESQPCVAIHLSDLESFVGGSNSPELREQIRQSGGATNIAVKFLTSASVPQDRSINAGNSRAKKAAVIPRSKLPSRILRQLDACKFVTLYIAYCTVYFTLCMQCVAEELTKRRSTVTVLEHVDLFGH